MTEQDKQKLRNAQAEEDRQRRRRQEEEDAQAAINTILSITPPITFDAETPAPSYDPTPDFGGFDGGGSGGGGGGDSF